MTSLGLPTSPRLLSSLHIGYDLLAAGGSALDAVIAVVSALESHPLFNAGVGSVFNTDGSHELDASVMEGERRRCGAVAAVRHVEHPVVLARVVMEQTSHCMIIGSGAEELARRHQAAYGIKLVSNDFFDVPERWRSLNDWRRQQGLEPLKGEGPVRGEVGGAPAAAAPQLLPLRRASTTSSAQWAVWPTTSTATSPQPRPRAG